MKSAPPILLSAVLGLGAVAAGCTTMDQARVSPMSFFVTSEPGPRGADLGGLAGADAHCAALASAAGSTLKPWRAYLSTTEPAGEAGVNARDRIGKGPWYNARGVMIASSVDNLHSMRNNLTKATALTEKGLPVPGRGDTPNQHDILTGSDPDGRFSTAGGDTTCGNWTRSGSGSAIVGHSDRVGLKDTRHMQSWNSSHGSAGCSADALTKTGGAGLLYCFAAH